MSIGFVRRHAALLVGLAAATVYASTLSARGWIRDDRWLIAENPALHEGWKAVPRLLTTGYVEAARGASPIGEYRPLLALSFWAQIATTGLDPRPLHAVNVLLHALVCVLLLEALRRRLPFHSAAAASIVFAVLPVHAEAVSYLTSRSELLVAISWLGCWRLLGAGRPPRLAGGLACFAAGLLSKEHAAMIPVFLALADWTFEGRKPWDADRRAVYGGLLAVGSVWLGARFAVLGGVGAAGVPYFPSRLHALAEWPAFVLSRYVVPVLTGTGLCADFSRGFPPPLTWTPAAAASLAVLAGWVGACAAGVARRRAWAFWSGAPALFLLPTCPLLVALDTIGAERFLYIPSLTAAVAAGWGFEALRERARLPAYAALGALAAWYATMTVSRNRVWLSDRAYFEAALACNPSSARARTGLAVALIEAGERPRAAAMLIEAARLDPTLADPPYNLSKLAWEAGDFPAVERLAARAVALDPTSADARVMLALAHEAQGRPKRAVEELERALAVMPWNEAARHNLARLRPQKDAR